MDRCRHPPDVPGPLSPGGCHDNSSDRAGYQIRVGSRWPVKHRDPELVLEGLSQKLAIFEGVVIAW